MNWLFEIGRRLLMLIRRRRFDRDLDEEMRLHRELREREEIERGLSPEEARYAAHKRFGNDLVLREESRDMWGWNWLETFLQDVRYGLRQLGRNPGFTVVAVLTLALGIGANTAIFSVVNGVLLRPLRYADSERLVVVWEANPKQGYTDQNASPADFVDWRTQSRAFTQMAAFINWGANLSGGDRPERVNATLASANLFDLLGVKPFLGRTLLPEDQQIIPFQVAVLSYDLWQRRFGADRDLIGRSVQVNGRSLTVVGIMPPGFHFPAELGEPADLWFPLARPASEWKIRDFHYLHVIGRLKPDVTFVQAQAEMSALQHGIMEQHPNVGAGSEISLIPLHQAAVGKVRKALLVLLGAVGFVLLIGCANVANLLLARASSRGREFAVRVALGAGHSRLVRQLLTESFLLSGLGCLLGVILGEFGVRALSALAPTGFPRFSEIHIDLPVLSLAVLASALTALLFGLGPALKASRTNPNESVKEGSRSAGGGTRGNRVRSGLLVSEVALSLVLLTGAGLLIRSFVRLGEVNPGFNPDHLLTLQITLAGPKYPKPHQQAVFFSEIIEGMKILPGVTGAAATTALPLSGESDSYSVDIEGRPTSPNSHMLTADYSAVTPSYFRTLGIPLIRGRAFTERDSDDAPPVVVINETFARRYFPDENPIGKRIHVGNDRHSGYSEIVGVVGDVRHAGLEAEVNPAIYESYLQSPTPWMDIAVRTSFDPLSIAAAVRGEMSGIDKDQPISKLRTMRQILDGSVGQPRFRMMLLSIFAALALGLAAVGVYGVMSYAVAQRTHEIGIRVALGATRHEILLLSLRQGFSLTTAGIGVGFILALGVSRLLTGFLYGVRPSDPLTFGAVSCLLMGVALIASYIPARRAAKVDPMVALRHE